MKASLYLYGTIESGIQSTLILKPPFSEDVVVSGSLQEGDNIEVLSLTRFAQLYGSNVLKERRGINTLALSSRQKEALHEWLAAPQWQDIAMTLSKYADTIECLQIYSNDVKAWCVPWRSWNVFKNTNFPIVFSPLTYSYRKQKSFDSQIRVLCGFSRADSALFSTHDQEKEAFSTIVPSLDRHRGLKKKAAISGIASFAALGIVAIAQSLGLLQGFELKTYDAMVRWRSPSLAPHEDLVVVTIGEKDLAYQDDNGYEGEGSMSDLALLELMRENPGVLLFVSDIFHDFDFHPDITEAQLKKYIGVCLKDARTIEDEIAPPPGVTFGFANLVPDEIDRTTRRALLGQTSGQLCDTTHALSIQVAWMYSNSEFLGPDDKDNLVIKTSDDRLVKIPALPHNAGGYALPPREARGYQTLYRFYRDPSTITLRDALEKGLPEGKKLVLYGVDRPGVDRHFTPVGERAGVFLHAQAISLLLHAIEGQRPIPWWLPQPVEYLWIWLWGVAGTVSILSSHPWRNTAIVLFAAYTSTSMVFLVWNG